MTEAYIFDAVRTPRGKGRNTGSLHEVKPVELLATTLHALALRNNLETAQVNDLLIGCVTPVFDQGADIAKTALLYAGWANSVSGMQLNRFCSSGLEAINLAAAKIVAGWDDLVVAGGVESMSRVPMGMDGGSLMFDPNVSIKTGYIPQGISADLIATMEGFTRTDLDGFAVLSQQRAAAAQLQGFFEKSIIPVYDQNGLLILDKDEHLRPETSLESLASLPSAFNMLGKIGYDNIALEKYPYLQTINHLHTAGNSSGIVDGASLVLLGSLEKGKALGLKPRAKIRSVANVSTEPTIMLLGLLPATEKALQKAGMTQRDIDLWEINEAFAAVVLKFHKTFQVPFEKINVNGGAIALGHPLGATGAVILNTLLDELERRDLQTGLATLCVGGGMGVATIIERV